jgi:hypothetical protein
MMNFDRIGAENLRDKSLRNPASAETDLPSSFGDLLDASLKVIHSEEIGGATARTQFGFVTESFNKMKEFDSEIMPDPYAFSNPAMAYDVTGTMMSNQWIAYYKTDSVTKKIKALQQKYPDQKFQTWDELKSQTIDPWFAANRQDLAIKQDKTGKGLQLGTGLVSGLTELSDPMIAPFALIGPTVGTAKTLRQIPGFAGTALVKEAIYAGTLETARMPIITLQKQDINSPFGLKNAVERIVMVAGGAGIVRSGGSVAFDLVHLSKLSKKLRVEGKTAEADVLDSYSDLMADAPTAREKLGLSDQDKQILAYTKVQEALEVGTIPKQADLDEITGATGVERIEPEEIFVDAETYQFKESDKEGITDRLDGVKEWDPYQAGIVMVFEDASGKRFIVDGHQRLALAKRLGVDQDGIELNAFVLREKDGFTPAVAREMAARVNISQGTGTALDAAKVLRAASETGGAFIDTLPPNSALVRNARGLANLDDASFRMVIDEMIDEKYGAIVGELISDAAAQAAVIRALVKAKPSNANQARFMINDMKAAGFTKTKTQDLFGGHTVTESLFKERAKVIDSTMKKLKKDKQVFKTLADQEKRIMGEGNVLDREANLARLLGDDNLLMSLSKLANMKGPVSDAVNKAARALKEGKSISSVTDELLDTIKKNLGDFDVSNRGLSEADRSGLQDDGSVRGSSRLVEEEGQSVYEKGTRSDPDRADDGGLQGLERGFDNDRKIKPYNKAQEVAAQYAKDAGLEYNPQSKYRTVDKEFAKKVADAFDELEHNPQDPKVKVAYQALVDETTAQYDAILKTGLKIEFIADGAPDPYPTPWGVIDDVVENNHMYVFSTRKGFGSDAKFNPLENPLLAETSYKISGEVALANDLFRVVHDYFGHVKEGVGFRSNGEENAFLAHSAMFSPIAQKALATETRGQNSWVNFGPHEGKNKSAKVEDTIFADQKIGLLPDELIDPNNPYTSLKEKTIYHGTGDVFDDFDLEKTADGTIWFTDNKSQIEGGKVAASGKGHILERVINEEDLKLGGWGEADKWSTGELINRGYDGLKLIDPDSTTYQIFFPEKLKKVGQVNEAKPVELKSSNVKLNDQLKGSGLDLDDPYLNELHATELKQIDDLLAKHGDMEIPTGARLDVDGNEVVEFRTAKEIMQELDDEQKVIDDMFKCMGE